MDADSRLLNLWLRRLNPYQRDLFSPFSLPLPSAVQYSQQHNRGTLAIHLKGKFDFLALLRHKTGQAFSATNRYRLTKPPECKQANKILPCLHEYQGKTPSVRVSLTTELRAGGKSALTQQQREGRAWKNQHGCSVRRSYFCRGSAALYGSVTKYSHATLYTKALFLRMALLEENIEFFFPLKSSSQIEKRRAENAPPTTAELRAAQLHQVQWIGEISIQTKPPST